MVIGGWFWTLALVTAIVAVLHIVGSGRSWHWIWLILIMPVLGPMVYFLAEVVPYGPTGTPVNPFVWLLDRLVPGRELARLTDAIDRSPSVVNRQALAAYHARLDEWDEAERHLKACLTGIYKDDPGLKHALAEVRFRAGDLKGAFILLDETRLESPRHDPQIRDFLLARIAEEQGQRQEAIALYERLREAGPTTEEARVRLAMLLEEAGDVERARGLYKDVVRRMKAANRTYRREQHPWLKVARQRLKES